MTYIPTFQHALPTSDAESSDVLELARTEGVRVLDYQCRDAAAAGPTGDRFGEFTLILVRDGAFCYADHGYTRLLEPGAVVLGCAGDDYRCTHTYGCGDRGTMLQLSDAALAQLQADLAHRTQPRATVFVGSPGTELEFAL